MKKSIILITIMLIYIDVMFGVAVINHIDSIHGWTECDINVAFDIAILVLTNLVVSVLLYFAWTDRRK